MTLLALLGCPWIPPEPADSDSAHDTAPVCDEPVYRDADGDGFGNPDSPGDDGTCPDTEWVTNADDCDDSDPAVTENTWYSDADGDTYGDPESFLTVCANPGAYVADATDCDDHDDEIHPGADEICDDDDVDEDCDTLADDDDPGVETSTFTMFYADSDGDTFGDADALVEACDLPVGAVENTDDCDDTSAAALPGGTEVCDGLDNDCDGTTDVNATDESSFYADLDGDTYGDVSSVSTGCTAPPGTVADATDCDDTDPAYNPGSDESDCTDPEDYNCDGSVGYADGDADGSPACEDCDDADPTSHPLGTEVCDLADNDCNGATDDDPTDALSFYADLDGDTYGDASNVSTGCIAPAGTVTDATDCNDADAAYHPGADESDCTDPEDYNCDGSSGSDDADEDGFLACEECNDTSGLAYPGAIEVCDGVDNDCDGSTDVGATDEQAFYVDVDGDGFGDVSTETVGCAAPDDGFTWVTDGTDCDDTLADFNPDAVETCSDTEDYNCDGSVGFDDADGDGTAACEDCDDSDATSSPSGTEVCDGADNDCDGTADDGLSGLWYADGDGDTFGDPADVSDACAAPSGYVSDDSDCDDTTAAVSPDGLEICDGVDNDCDSTTDVNATDEADFYADADGDTFGDVSSVSTGCSAPVGTVSDNTDCDDTEAGVYPGATEVCDDLDNGCNGPDDDLVGAWYTDADNDGYGGSTIASTACTQPIHTAVAPDDCNDDEDFAFPGAPELCDTIDNDCDGATDDQGDVYGSAWYADVDGDGFGDSEAIELACEAPEGAVSDGTDCDDSDGTISPDAVEVDDDGIDQDCDGVDGAAGFVDYVATNGATMIAVLAGTFTMGGGVADAAGDYVDHEVTLTRDFYLAKTEITHAQWEADSENVGWDYSNTTSGSDPCSGTLANCPADGISWYDVATHANWLSEVEGLDRCYLPDGTDLDPDYAANPYACPGYRLPTEAEGSTPHAPTRTRCTQARTRPQQWRGRMRRPTRSERTRTTSARSPRTPGGSVTCPATSGSGYKTGMTGAMADTAMPPRRPIPGGQRRVPPG